MIFTLGDSLLLIPSQPILHQLTPKSPYVSSCRARILLFLSVWICASQHKKTFGRNSAKRHWTRSSLVSMSTQLCTVDKERDTNMQPSALRPFPVRSNRAHVSRTLCHTSCCVRQLRVYAYTHAQHMRTYAHASLLQ